MTTEELIALQGQIAPGPWRHAQEAVDPEWSVVTTAGGAVIANINDRAEQHTNATLIAAAPNLLAEVIRLRTFLYDLAIAKGETIHRRRRDPQDDEPDMMEADTFYAWQEDARALLAGKAGA